MRTNENKRRFLNICHCLHWRVRCLSSLQQRTLCSGVGLETRVPLPRLPTEPLWLSGGGGQLCRACCAYKSWAVLLCKARGTSSSSCPCLEPCDAPGRYRVEGVSVPPRTTAVVGACGACSRAETRLSPGYLTHSLWGDAWDTGALLHPPQVILRLECTGHIWGREDSFTGLNRREKPGIKDKLFNWKPQLWRKFAMPRTR